MQFYSNEIWKVRTQEVCPTDVFMEIFWNKEEKKWMIESIIIIVAQDAKSLGAV